MVLAVLLNFAASDLISSRLIKNNVERLRPCNDIELQDKMVKRVNCSGGYSFTSSHATNHFAMAVMLIFLFYRRWKPVLWIGLIWAGVISFAQVYVGVHFPLDVTVGSFLGIAIGTINGLIYNRYRKRKEAKLTFS